MPVLKAVLFDMDGLMLDSERLALASLRRTGDKLGIAMTEEILTGMIGLNRQASNKLIEEKIGRSFDKDAFSATFYADYQQVIERDGIPLKAGLLELLDYLTEQTIRRCVVTSTKTELAEMKLARAGIAEYFEFVIGGDQVVNGKPAPDPYLKALNELNLNADDCIVLEDSNNGALSAYRAGLRVIVVPDIKQPSAATRDFAYRIDPSLETVRHFLSENMDKAA